jgi:hypothetical protein
MIPELFVTFVPDYRRDSSNRMLIGALTFDLTDLKTEITTPHMRDSLDTLIKDTAIAAKQLPTQDDHDLYAFFVQFLNDAAKLFPKTTSYVLSTLINREMTRLVGTEADINKKLSFHRIAETLHMAKDKKNDFPGSFVPQPRRNDLAVFFATFEKDLIEHKKTL